VAILLANSLNFNILAQNLDPDENFLIVKVSLEHNTVILASIYGPNSGDRAFFSRLERGISELNEGGTVPVVVGGDWNTTWDSSPINSNIDTLNMAGLPNPQNCLSLLRICEKLKLTDPYRILYPNDKDYTYHPFGNLRKNRSRIDFFCISIELIPFITDCGSSSTTLCSLFDHKNIFLNIGKPPKFVKSKNISNKFLDLPIYEIAVKSTVIRTHLISINTDNQNLTENDRIQLLNLITNDTEN
jgi:exonuclease III